MSVNFMLGNFDDPSFSCPSLSAPPHGDRSARWTDRRRRWLKQSVLMAFIFLKCFRLKIVIFTTFYGPVLKQKFAVRLSETSKQYNSVFAEDTCTCCSHQTPIFGVGNLMPYHLSAQKFKILHYGQ